MKMKQGDKLELQWIDAISESGWWENDEIIERFKNFKPQFTIGYFVMKYKDWIIIAMTDVNNERLKKWGFWKAIPYKQVKKIRKLK